MSSKMILKCDRCRDESEKITLFDVILGTTKIYSPYFSDRVVPRYPEWKKEWCERCCGKFHLLKKVEPEKEPLPTLEDIVRDIVREEMK